MLPIGGGSRVSIFPLFGNAFDDRIPIPDFDALKNHVFHISWQLFEHKFQGSMEYSGPVEFFKMDAGASPDHAIGKGSAVPGMLCTAPEFFEAIAKFKKSDA